MSVRKSCENCKNHKHGSCYRKSGVTCNEDTGWICWELSDECKADLLHEDEEHSYWIPAEGEFVKCEECGYKMYAIEAVNKPYCPNCHRQMGEPMHDAVNHPNHYCKGGVECVKKHSG